MEAHNEERQAWAQPRKVEDLMEEMADSHGQNNLEVDMDLTMNAAADPAGETTAKRKAEEALDESARAGDSQPGATTAGSSQAGVAEDEDVHKKAKNAQGDDWSPEEWAEWQKKKDAQTAEKAQRTEDLKK